VRGSHGGKMQMGRVLTVDREQHVQRRWQPTVQIAFSAGPHHYHQAMDDFDFSAPSFHDFEHTVDDNIAMAVDDEYFGEGGMGLVAQLERGVHRGRSVFPRPADILAPVRPTCAVTSRCSPGCCYRPSS
jgi:hypothetical protein